MCSNRNTKMLNRPAGQPSDSSSALSAYRAPDALVVFQGLYSSTYVYRYRCMYVCMYVCIYIYI